MVRKRRRKCVSSEPGIYSFVNKSTGCGPRGDLDVDTLIPGIDYLEEEDSAAFSLVAGDAIKYCAKQRMEVSRYGNGSGSECVYCTTEDFLEIVYEGS